MNEQQRKTYQKFGEFAGKLRSVAQQNCQCDADVGWVCELCHDAAVASDFMKMFNAFYDRMIEIESEFKSWKEDARDLAKRLLRR